MPGFSMPVSSSTALSVTMLSIPVPLEGLFEVAERLQSPPLVLADPPFGNGFDRLRVQVVQLLAPALDGRHQVGRFEDVEVLGDGLAGHLELGAEGAERLAVVLEEAVQQQPAG